MALSRTAKAPKSPGSLTWCTAPYLSRRRCTSAPVNSEPASVRTVFGTMVARASIRSSASATCALLYSVMGSASISLEKLLTLTKR